MKRHFNLPALYGLLAAAGIAITVRHAAAAPNWSGAWGAPKRPGEIATCTHTGALANGGSIPNGNDASQLMAWCANYWCGVNGSTQYLVRGQGCTAVGDCEYTDASSGQSVGSTTLSAALTWHRCQMGTRPYIPPPP